jgi:hypothetical protein
MSLSSKPVRRIRRSPVQAIIWAHKHAKGEPFYTVSLHRRHPPGIKAKWTSGVSYTRSEVLELLKVADQALAAIGGFRAAADADRQLGRRAR